MIFGFWHDLHYYSFKDVCLIKKRPHFHFNIGFGVNKYPVFQFVNKKNIYLWNLSIMTTNAMKKLIDQLSFFGRSRLSTYVVRSRTYIFDRYPRFLKITESIIQNTLWFYSNFFFFFRSKILTMFNNESKGGYVINVNINLTIYNIK